MIKRNILLGVGILAAALFAGPAQAIVTTFASFTNIGSSTNLRWVVSDNDAGGNFSRNATFYTTQDFGSTEPGTSLVQFSFLQPQLAPLVFNTLANFTLTGSVTSTIATLQSGLLVQNNLTASFSFRSLTPIFIDGTEFAPGSNLLSGSFSSGVLAGVRNSNSGGISAADPFASITYTSDFLTFSPFSSNDSLALSLTSISPRLNALNAAEDIMLTPTRAVRSFRAVAQGDFSSDPAPEPVPEPATWGMLIVGFGMVGFVARRRKAVAAA